MFDDETAWTVNEVSDFLKTKCRNHIVAFGFTAPYHFSLARQSLQVSMGQRLTVENMIGNLSHVIRDGYGNDLMMWPSSMPTGLGTTYEYVTADTLNEMGMKSNEEKFT